MRWLIVLIFSINLFANNVNNVRSIVKWDDKLVKEYKEDFKRYILTSNERMKYLRYVWEHAKEYNLGYTALAIAWEESKFNLWDVNTITGDYGLMGVNIKWYLINKGIKASYWQKKAIVTKLIRNDEMNLNYSLSELMIWRSKLGRNNWIKIWACYNGGSVPNYYYAKRILNRIIVLKRYLKLK